MSLRFDGFSLGLNTPRTESGDRNDASNYNVICHCGMALGPLSRWSVTGKMHAMGGDHRMVSCMQCGDLSIFQGHTVVKVVPKKEVEQKMLSVRPILNPRKSWVSGEKVTLCLLCARVTARVFDIQDHNLAIIHENCGGCRKLPTENEVFRRFTLSDIHQAGT